MYSFFCRSMLLDMQMVCVLCVCFVELMACCLDLLNLVLFSGQNCQTYKDGWEGLLGSNIINGSII